MRGYFRASPRPPSTPDEILDTFLHWARPVEGEHGRLISRVPGEPYNGTLCAFLDTKVRAALRSSEEPRAARARWYSGAYLLETMPTALAILAQHRDDPRTAILEAVNDTWDNDTIASMVASAMGALHGADAFDRSWIRELEDGVGAAGDDSLVGCLDQARRWLPTGVRED